MQIRIRCTASIIIAYILSTIFLIQPIKAEQGLIISLPSSKQLKYEHQKAKEKKPNKNITKRQNSKTYLPLPVSIEKRNKQKRKIKQKKSTYILPIKIKKDTKQQYNSATQNNIQIHDDITLSPSNVSIGDTLVEPNIDTGFDSPNLSLDNSQPSNLGDLPSFPKDTSSAIFMVMKTWQCEDYSVNKLLQHATDVYGQEGDDPFQIIGLSEEFPYQINVDEEDITLDELLDIIAQKTRRNWGVDMQSKTIYFYPPAKM